MFDEIDRAIDEATALVGKEIYETNRDYAIGLDAIYRLILQFEDTYGDKFLIPVRKDDPIHSSKHFRQLIVAASIFSSIAAFKYQEMANDKKLNMKDYFNYRIYCEKIVEMISRGLSTRAPNE